MALSCEAVVNTVKLEGGCGDVEWSNELDHLPLIQRRKLLLSQNRTKTPPQTEISVKMEDERCSSQDQISLVEPAKMKVESFDYLQRSLEVESSGSASADVQALKLRGDISNRSSDDLDDIVLEGRKMMLLPRKMSCLEKPSTEVMPLGSKSFDRPCCVPTSIDNMPSSVLVSTVKVKDEPVSCNESYDPGRNGSLDCQTDFAPAKNETGFPCEFGNDNLDHMKLQDRMKPQTGDHFDVNISGNPENLKKTDSSAFEASAPIKIHHPRKRKKTATDSIETALEEDAPGLLGVLMEQGVSVDEIKLYGEADSEEPIDESFIVDGFADLEAVMSKLFLHRSSLSNLALLRCSKGSKPSYCLGCLLSLVEQARYLHFRNWPAEWGWCRDLQSFIFIFEKHKRIVLERPEYGFASYFFELVDSASIGWQIQRLVAIMKLTNCGRITLIENKALVVGEDITEGEAHVLMQFGWIPNSGLGTMLNYCDRVVHDRKHEKDTSEWRSKICKLLIKGYSGGTLVSSNYLTDVDCTSSENPQIKVEL